MINTTYHCDLCGLDVTGLPSNSMRIERRVSIGTSTENYDVCRSCQVRLDFIIKNKEWKTR